MEFEFVLLVGWPAGYIGSPLCRTEHLVKDQLERSIALAETAAHFDPQHTRAWRVRVDRTVNTPG